MAEMEASGAQSTSARERLSEIILAFRDGVPREQALALVRELRGFPTFVRVDASDDPDAEYMLWFLQLLVIPITKDESLVFTPDPGPTVEYLRRTRSGLWKSWYPGEAIE